MERLAAWWRALNVCRNQPLFSVRVLSILSFAAVLGAFIARGVRASSLGDFLGGMAVSFSAILMMQIFSMRKAESKSDPEEDALTGLHLSH